jgi:asparagine synthase (glutamine-hydrolysing)
MSAIFGCVHLDGRPLPPATGERMRRAMLNWGPDGVSSAQCDDAAMGFANLAITPESIHESMPYQAEHRGKLFTSAARLDNREGLCQTFGVPAVERERLPDSTLVMHACRTWGEDAPRHLFGDWSCASWDSRTRTLFLARDQLGNTGVYYHYQPPLFAFSSDPEALFALGNIERRINEHRIASYLTLFPQGKPEDTSWTNIHRLLPGSSLTATPQGMHIRQYWNMDDIPTAGGLRDDEYVACFLERYRTAVQARLRSRRPIGATLSAGLDSGSVTALAAQALSESGRTLTAFTSVPLHRTAGLAPGALTDEWPMARAVSRLHENIDHHAIDAAALSPLEGIERAVAIFPAPQHAAVNEFWIMAVHDAARERGIGVMLTGQLGNGGVSWSGGQDSIFWLFADGKWDEGLKAMAQWKRRNGFSWVRTLAVQLVKPWLRPYWRHGLSMRKGSSAPWSSYAAIHPEFASRIGLRQAMRAARHDATLSRVPHPREQRRLALMRNGAVAGPILHRTGAAFGMEIRDPTSDIRLLEYCLSIPGAQDTFDGGERMLVRRAMEGILPLEVQWNRIRGKQAADAALRLLHHPEEMESMLKRLENNEEVTTYLELPRMRSVWRALQAEVSERTVQQAETLLLRGIMCGCFIEYAGRMR